MMSLRLLCVDWSCAFASFSRLDQIAATHTIARDIATSNNLSLSRRRWLLPVMSWRWCVNAAQMHFLAHMDDEIQGTTEAQAQVIRPPGPLPFLSAQKRHVSWGHRDCNENKDTDDESAFEDAKPSRQSHPPHSSDQSRHDRPSRRSLCHSLKQNALRSSTTFSGL